MMKGNTIVFGFGTTLVSAGIDMIEFLYVEPEQEIGGKAQGEYEILDRVNFSFEDDFYGLLRELRQMKEGAVLSFRGYSLDFTNYNPKSVEVVVRAIEHALRLRQLALAC